MDDGRPPFSLFPTRPDAEKPGVVASVGAGTVGAYRQTFGLAETLLSALASPFIPGAAARRVANTLAIRQVFFTGFQALPLVSVIAVFVGTTMVLQMKIMAAALPPELLGQILVAVVLRELAPLATATIVAGRSGTAIATELGNMKADAEVLGLSSLGIDPARFIVWPRLVGSIVSVFVLTIYFGVIAILSGYFIGNALGASFTSLRAGFSEALLPADLALYFVKCIGLGAIVGWLCCHFGLNVRSSPTEVPQKASQAVIMSLLGCVVYNTIVTASFYWVVGAPVQ